MDFQKTQIGRMVEQIKIAMLAHTPIIYIPTDQLELINEILFGEQSADSVMPRLCYNSNDSSILHLGQNEFFRESKSISDNYQVGLSFDIKNIHTPTLYISYIEQWEKSPITTSLNAFISAYLNTKSSKNYNVPEKVDLVRRSLWIVVTPDEQTVPRVLSPYICTVRVGAISDEEIESIIFTQLDKNLIPRTVLSDKHSLFSQMKVSFRGFSALRIKQLMDQLIACQNIDYDTAIEEEIISAIHESKKQILANCPGLHWEDTNAVDAAGLDGITEWLNDHSIIFEDPKRAKEQHVDIPNAVLITGIPGSGKSLMAKTAANKLKMPLISLDMGALRGGIQGESEHNMINALHIAENMAPCVLWVDEIEKAFSSSDSGTSDGGVGQRMFGKFLTWMQEKTSACFVFATSNDVTKLPPELFRSERFDRKFFTFMPTAEECAQIFVGSLKKQNEDYQKELTGYRKQERSSMSSELFPKSLIDSKVWLKVLDDFCSDHPAKCSLQEEECKGNECKTYLWKVKQKPSNKLLTGADISSIIKEAKFKVNPQLQPSSGSSVYDHDAIIGAVKAILKDFRPYGETNLSDIAKCFFSLFKNQFEPASGKSFLDFKQFDDDNMIYTPYKEQNITYGTMRLYDKVLYDTMVGAINYYLPKTS